VLPASTEQAGSQGSWPHLEAAGVGSGAQGSADTKGFQVGATVCCHARAACWGVQLLLGVAPLLVMPYVLLAGATGCSRAAGCCCCWSWMPLLVLVVLLSVSWVCSLACRAAAAAESNRCCSSLSKSLDNSSSVNVLPAVCCLVSCSVLWAACCLSSTAAAVATVWNVALVLPP
jgi:hypothetical protein